MALMTHQVQCSYAPSRPPSWKREIKSKQLLVPFPKVNKTYAILLKRRSRLCISVPHIHGSYRKSLIISSYKSGIQDSKETIYDEPMVQNDQLPGTLESNGTIAGSVAMQNLFRSWLTLLRMPSTHQVSEGILDGPFRRDTRRIEKKET